MGAPPGKERRPSPLVRRVQRPTSDFPVVHLEAEIPRPRVWTLTIQGLVAHPLTWTLDELRGMSSDVREWDLHCVWGWTRPKLRWEGVPLSRLIDACMPLDSATHAMARQIEGPYASCLTLDEARSSLLALRCDDEDLSPDHGGPLRLVPPSTKWGFKHVKWVGSLAFIAGFVAGFWEDMVGDPHGTVPVERLDLRFE